MKRKSKYQTLIGVCLCLSFSFYVFSCAFTSLRSSDLPYSNYSDFYLDDLDNFYSQNESRYIIYLYSNSCTYCDEIKGNLFDHLDELEESGSGIACYIYNMYSRSSSEGSSNRAYFKVKEDGYDQDELVNEMKNNAVDSISETYFFGTPSIYLIENSKFSALYYGTTECAQFLDSN